MSSSAGSSSSLFSHGSAPPSLPPFPHSLMISMLFHSRIDYVPDVGNGDRGLCDIGRNDKFPAVRRSWLENKLLFGHWKRRVETVNKMSFMLVLGILHFFFIYHFFIFILAYFYWIIWKSLLKHVCDFMDFVFTCHEDKYISIG